MGLAELMLTAAALELRVGDRALRNCRHGTETHDLISLVFAVTSQAGIFITIRQMRNPKSFEEVTLIESARARSLVLGPTRPSAWPLAPAVTVSHAGLADCLGAPGWRRGPLTPVLGLVAEFSS